jgi:starvation-inducible DNA-binding protein
MTTTLTMKTEAVRQRRIAPLSTPTGLKAVATRDITAAMNGVLADAFALYIKTKNFHWHMSGPLFSRLPSAADHARLRRPW